MTIQATFRSLRGLAVLIGACAISVPASFGAINKISNGSFESTPYASFPNGAKTGGGVSIPGWTVTTSSPQQGVAVINYGGSYYGENFPADNVLPTVGSPDLAGGHGVYFVDDSSLDILSQTVTGLTPGLVYKAGFDLFVTQSGLNNVTNNDFSHNAAVQLSISGVKSPAFLATSLPVRKWFNEEVSFKANNAGTANFKLTFLGGFAPAADFLVDRAYVTAAPTPEPSFYGAMAAGLSGLIFAVRRRRQKA